MLWPFWGLSSAHHLLPVPVRLDWSIMGCTMRLRALMNLGGWAEVSAVRPGWRSAPRTAPPLPLTSC